MLLDPRRPRLGWVSGDLVQAPHPSLRLTSAQNFQSEACAALSEDFLYWGAASYPVKSRGARLPERQPAVPFSVVRPARKSSVRACCVPRYLSQKFDRPLPTKDGGTLRTVLDARSYMLQLSKDRQRSAQWQRAAQLAKARCRRFQQAGRTRRAL
jgi:hypothetical protein